MQAYTTIGGDATVPWLPSSHRLLPRSCQATADVHSAAQRGSSSCTPEYQAGDKVRVTGLPNATHLNGRVATVTSIQSANGTLCVEFEGMPGCVMKLLARFAACIPEDASRSFTNQAEDCGNELPVCVTDVPEHDEATVAARERKRRGDTLNGALQAVCGTLCCLQGRAFSSPWAIHGCDPENSTTRSANFFGKSCRRWNSKRFEELHSRHTWGMPQVPLGQVLTETLAKDPMVCSGDTMHSVADIERVLCACEQTLRHKIEVTASGPDAPCPSASDLGEDVVAIEKCIEKVVELLQQVATLFQRVGRWEETAEVAAGGLGIARRTRGGSRAEALLSVTLARAKHAMGRHVEALHLAHQAAVLFRHCEDGVGQAEAAMILGHCQARMWRPREAGESLAHALALYRALSLDVKPQIEILGLLGNVLAEMGLRKEAMQHAEEALALSESADDKTLSALALGALAEVHARVGDHSQSAQIAHKLQKCVTEGDMLEKIRALKLLGQAQLASGAIEEAEQTFMQQRDASLSFGNMAGAADALQNLGCALVALRQYEVALDCVRHEEVLWDCIGDFGRRRLCLDRMCKLLDKMKCKGRAMEIRRAEGVALHPLAPLFSSEDEHQLHFDEDRVILAPRLRHNEQPHPWTLPLLPSQYLLWGNRFHLSSSPGRRVMLNFPAGYIKKDFEAIKKLETAAAEPPPPPSQPRKSFNLV